MIKTYTLLFLLFSCITHAQNSNSNSEPVTVNRLKYMAVYPGCEAFTGQKRNLIMCFGRELQKDVLRYLNSDFPDFDVPKKYAKVQIGFVVSTEGIITEISPKSGDDAFKAEGVRTMKKVSDYLVRKGQYIIPGKLADGNIVPLNFHNNIILRNPDYDDSDWIIYYYKKNFSVDGIYENLKDRGIYQFDKRKIKHIIKQYKNRQNKRY